MVGNAVENFNSQGFIVASSSAHYIQLVNNVCKNSSFLKMVVALFRHNFARCCWEICHLAIFDALGLLKPKNKWWAEYAAESVMNCDRIWCWLANHIFSAKTICSQLCHCIVTAEDKCKWLCILSDFICKYICILMQEPTTALKIVEHLHLFVAI